MAFIQELRKYKGRQLIGQRGLPLRKERPEASQTPFKRGSGAPGMRTLLLMRLYLAITTPEEVPKDVTVGMVMLVLIAAILVIPIILAIALRPGRSIGRKKFKHAKSQPTSSAWEESGRRLEPGEDDHMENYG